MSQQRFHVPYMHCGCPLPVSAHVFPFQSRGVDLYSHRYQGETIGQKISRLSDVILRSRHEIETSIDPPDRDDCLLATHPSDHNAVYVDVVSHKGRQKRLSKTQKRKERDKERMKQGKLDEKTYERGLAHGDAFLTPVPTYYYGYGIPGTACSGGFGMGCAVVSGSLSHRSCLCFLSSLSIGSRWMWW